MECVVTKETIANFMSHTVL